MKKVLYTWLLVTLLMACKEKHEPTLNEIVVGIYDTPSHWVLVDSIKVGLGCKSSFLVVRENEQGFLDIKATCNNLDFLENIREVKGMVIRESIKKTVWWLNPGDVLYELYDSQSNTMGGVFYQLPGYKDLQISLRAKTTKGDTLWTGGPKRVD